MTGKKTRDERVRNWGFIVYPDSAPENWRDLLDDLHVEWVESPLHEFDTNENGECKKAHWHVLIMFEGKKSYTQAKEIADMVNAANPQVVHSVKGNVRYMAHLDNPEKYQYSPSAIRVHGGADLTDLLKPTRSARHEMIAEMIDFVDDNGITEYFELLRYARSYRFDDWFAVLCDSSSLVMNAYIRSKRHAKKPGPFGQCDDVQ